MKRNLLFVPVAASCCGWGAAEPGEHPGSAGVFHPTPAAPEAPKEPGALPRVAVGGVAGPRNAPIPAPAPPPAPASARPDVEQTMDADASIPAVSAPFRGESPREPMSPLDFLKMPPDMVPIYRDEHLFWFYDKLEVTVAEYRECVKSKRCAAPKGRGIETVSCTSHTPGKDRHPVTCVTVEQARQFCRWRKKVLPHAALHEMAAHQGRGSDYHPWGFDPAHCKYANVGLPKEGCGFGGTWPVGSRPEGATYDGVHDLIGNVAEWVDNAGVSKASGPAAVGGGWRTNPRWGMPRRDWNDDTGFRCAKGVSYASYREALENGRNGSAHVDAVDADKIASSSIGSSLPRGDRLPELTLPLVSLDIPRDMVPIYLGRDAVVFYDKFEVTVAEYEECVDARRCSPPKGAEIDPVSCKSRQEGKGRYPVTCVTGQQARQFCVWKNKDLPDKRMYEMAAHQGRGDYYYPWGFDSPHCKYANVGFPEEGCGFGGAWPVGSRAEGATRDGIYDLIGNVAEWVYVVDVLKSRFPVGGGWRVSPRWGFPWRDWNDDTGFRCAREVPLLASGGPS